MAVPVNEPFELVLPKERQADTPHCRGKGSYQALSYQENVSVYLWPSSAHKA